MGGVEADLQISGQGATPTYVCPGAICNPTIVGFDAPVTATFEQGHKFDSFGTLARTLRLDHHAGLMAYATGGLAVGSIRSTVSLAGTGFDADGNPGLVSNTFSKLTQKAGWTVGAGLEGRLFGNVTGKVEYLYLDFGTVSTSVHQPAQRHADRARQQCSHITDNIVRAGLNYKFDPAVGLYDVFTGIGAPLVYKAPVSKASGIARAAGDGMDVGRPLSRFERRLRLGQVQHRHHDQRCHRRDAARRHQQLRQTQRHDRTAPRPASIGSAGSGVAGIEARHPVLAPARAGHDARLRRRDLQSRARRPRLRRAGERAHGAEGWNGSARCGDGSASLHAGFAALCHGRPRRRPDQDLGHDQRLEPRAYPDVTEGVVVDVDEDGNPIEIPVEVPIVVASADPTSTTFFNQTTKLGWTVGAGAEVRLGGNWTGKVEYLYLDFGTVSTSGIAAAERDADRGQFQFPHHRQSGAARASTTNSIRSARSTTRPQAPPGRWCSRRRCARPGPGPASISAAPSATAGARPRPTRCSATPQAEPSCSRANASSRLDGRDRRRAGRLQLARRGSCSPASRRPQLFRPARTA